MNAHRPHLRVVDMAVAANSPAGSCVMTEVVGLAEEFDVTVFAQRCELPQRAGLRWVHVPAPARPLVLRYAIFWLLAGPLLWWDRRRAAAPPPDWTQTTQGQYADADIAYAHFCHRGYLAGAWKASPVRGLRRAMRWLNHRFNAFCEQRAFRRARLIVAPSRGLAAELQATYPFTAGRVVTLPNPVDLDRFRPPADVGRSAWRGRLGLPPQGTLFSFVALGDFDRKGLGLVLPALASLGPQAAAQLVVVGGRAGEVAAWSARAARLGLAERVHFVGMQADVRPYLWASDAFVFPSAYEIFSLAILQAAAAGLPVIVSRGLAGAEEFVRDGANGWLVERSAEGVGAALHAAIDEPARRDTMGQAAAQSVQRYSREAFVQRWRELYRQLRSPQVSVLPAEQHGQRADVQ